MLAQWILLLLTLPGWLLPSGASLPLCGCLSRPAGEDACCRTEAVVEDGQTDSCCGAGRSEDSGTSDENRAAAAADDCCCSVTAPPRDDGPLPLAAPRAAPALAAATPCLLVAAAPSAHRPCRVHPCARGPAPGRCTALPLRL